MHLEMREIREVRGERVKGPKPIDPIALIPDELWDATLFAILDHVVSSAHASTATATASLYFLST